MKKDKKWAQREVDRYLSYEGVNEARNALMFAKGVISQLEEPEKPVIPKFVADWIVRRKGDFKNGFDAARYLMEYGWDDESSFEFKIYEWIKGKERIFIEAFDDGYEVEKEKLYYLRLRDEDLPLYKAYDMKRWKYKLVYSAYHLRNENFLTVTFSESEIENMDIRSFELEEVTE